MGTVGMVLPCPILPLETGHDSADYPKLLLTIMSGLRGPVTVSDS